MVDIQRDMSNISYSHGDIHRESPHRMIRVGSMSDLSGIFSPTNSYDSKEEENKRYEPLKMSRSASAGSLHTMTNFQNGTNSFPNQKPLSGRKVMKISVS